ncbi:MAG: hypothetical protein DI531_13025 [Brevundimonas sp.]|nr:MAG: hypothetical protein DI531_13025 [Brevundimonas sp.]
MARAGVTAAQILADPAASFALKAVLTEWRRRDPIDAANDARLLRDVLEDEVDRRLAGRCHDRG